MEHCVSRHDTRRMTTNPSLPLCLSPSLWLSPTRPSLFPRNGPHFPTACVTALTNAPSLLQQREFNNQPLLQQPTALVGDVLLYGLIQPHAVPPTPLFADRDQFCRVELTVLRFMIRVVT